MNYPCGIFIPSNDIYRGIELYENLKEVEE
jgi:hypothetical protein